MAQATRRKSRKSRKRKTDGASWTMLVVGLVCGAILSALYFGYRENEPGRFGSGIRSLLEQEDDPAPQAQASQPEKKAKPAPKVKLDYHEVLPNIDEVISESEVVVAEEPVEKRPAGDKDSQYVLQAGSYKSAGDAESMKAKLALAGFEAVIQRVNIASKGTYYRVRMGPYDSRRKLDVDRKRLARQGIDALAVRLQSPEEQARQTN